MTDPEDDEDEEGYEIDEDFAVPTEPIEEDERWDDYEPSDEFLK